MKRSKSTLLVLIFFLSCSFFNLALTAGVEYQVDVASRYIWRGFDLNPDNKPVLQPSVTFSCGDSGFAVNLWSSFSFEAKELNEIDVTLSYDFKMPEDFSLSVGFTHYGWYFNEGFKFKNHTTQEFYVAFGLPKVPLAPNLTVYYDFGNGDGFYLLLGVGHSLPLSETINLDLSASLGYNGKQWIGESGLSDLNFNVTIPFKVGKVTISPFFNVTLILLDAVNPDVDNEIWGGVSLVF